MKKTLLIISGWAHSTNAIQPLGDRLATHFDVQLLSGATALTQQTLPQADAILTGSMGGLIAFEQLPKRCQKLVLLSGTACFCKQPDYEHGTAPRILKRMQKQLDQDPHTLIQTFFKNVHAPHLPSHQKKQPPPPRPARPPSRTRLFAQNRSKNSHPLDLHSRTHHARHPRSNHSHRSRTMATQPPAPK